MELLSIQVAFSREVGNTFIIYVITYFPLLSLTELVDYPDDSSVPVGSKVFFTYFSKYPPSGTIFTINKLIYLDLIIIKIHIL